MAGVLQPVIPFHEDEVTQGYFARIGHFQAGVDAARFCKFFDLGRADFREGNDPCIEVIAAISGEDPDRLRHNTIRQLSDGSLMLRGETLGLQVIRRVTTQFCPHCLTADDEDASSLGKAAWRFRWSWLLKPVVACPLHNTALVSVPAKDPVNAFDLRKLYAQSDLDLVSPEGFEPHFPGSLQKYVVARIGDHATACPWLDGQGVAEGVRACEMLGSLICDGPTAEIKKYTDLDWARVGSVGFDVCSDGPTAIREALATIRLNAGRRSGRTGPQAVFGSLFNWLKKSGTSRDEGPIRDVVREAIIENFAVGSGEMVLGEFVNRRKVHSVNSLTSKTGLNRFRLYRIIRKAGMIPDDTDRATLNQLVFPAEKAELLIARIQNAIPQNQIQRVLGCSKTHAEQLVKGGLISSVVSMAEGQVGLTRGDFNVDDLSGFLKTVCVDVRDIDCEIDGFIDLTQAARGRSPTVEIIAWQIGGRLRKTCLLDGIKRFDNLRFCLTEIRQIVDESRGRDPHRLTSVAKMLCMNLPAVKQLVSRKKGGPWLQLVSGRAAGELRGKAYVAHAELERFKERYTTPGLVARSFGMNHRTVLKALDATGVETAFDPHWLGARVYLRAEVDAQTSNLLEIFADAVSAKPNAVTMLEMTKFCARNAERGPTRESDGSFR
ncbi:MAG: TniQ family protein [Rhodobacterales bacterium]